MVIENPMLFTIVSAVPLVSFSELFATNVENNGESAITTMPQKSRKPINTKLESHKKIKGEKMQHMQDKNNAIAAVFFVPNRWDKYPPRTHDNPPIPIIKNDRRGVLS